MDLEKMKVLDLMALVKRQEAELAEARTVPESGMPVDMSQAKRWVTQLRARIESLLDVINEPSASLPAAGAVLTDERAAFEAAVNPVKDGYGGYSFDYMAQWAGWQARAILAAQPAAAAPDVQPVAWLKEWDSVGHAAKNMRRVDLTPDCETWLANMFPRITPLYAAAQPEAKAAPAQAEADAERERGYRENAAFHQWWKSSGQKADHDLKTENAAHATWQERARRDAAAPAMGEELPHRREK